jgi:hypothetical protein
LIGVIPASSTPVVLGLAWGGLIGVLPASSTGARH